MLPVSNNIPFFNLFVKPVYGIRFPNWGVRSRVSVDGYSLVWWHCYARRIRTVPLVCTLMISNGPVQSWDIFRILLNGFFHKRFISDLVVMRDTRSVLLRIAFIDGLLLLQSPWIGETMSLLKTRCPGLALSTVWYVLRIAQATNAR
jgi:hypothetical protein